MNDSRSPSLNDDVAASDASTENADDGDQVSREALAAELERVRGLFREAQRIGKCGAFDWDVRTDEITWTDGVFDLLGRSREAMEHSWEGLLACIHPGDRVHVEHSATQAIEAGLHPPITYRVLWPNGEVHRIVSRGEVTYEDDRPVRMVGFMQDVTEQHRAREKLRIQEERFRLVVENAQPIVFMIDRHGTYQLLEGRDLARLGVAPGSYEGRSAFEVNANRPEVLASIQRALEGEPVQDVVTVDQIVIDDVEKSPATFEVWYTPYYDAEGEVAGCMGVGVDVTEKVEQERRLRRSEMLLKEAQDIAHLGYWTLDVEAGELEWSDETYRIYGYEPGEVEPRIETYFDAIPDEEREAIVEAHSLALETGEMPMSRHGVIRPDGSRRVVEVRGRTMEFDGDRPVFVAGTVLDVTEQYEIERALRRARDEAKAAARLKASMLANMSHEIRTPLTAIVGFAELIEEEAEGEIRSFATHVRRSSVRLQKTLDSVIHLARLESGRVELHVETVDLNAEARASIADLALQIRDKQLNVDVDLAAASVETDRGAVQRILQNLISNAVKFTPEGGRIAVRTSSQVHKGRATCWIEVEDTGIGIDPSFRALIFQAFTQESEGYDREHGGVGLGLAIVHRLVEHLGGTIELETTPGQGARFAVFFPAEA